MGLVSVLLNPKKKDLRNIGESDGSLIAANRCYVHVALFCNYAVHRLCERCVHDAPRPSALLVCYVIQRHSSVMRKTLFSLLKL